MSAGSRPLRGSCACGRNHYTISIPQNSTSSSAQVFFDTSNEHRNNLSPHLRIPLTWYSSTTSAFYPDETHTSIRRLYSSPTYPHTRRCFCGYCGEALSVWHETTKEDAEFIELMIGTLRSNDLELLQELGVVPGEEEENEVDAVGGVQDKGREELVVREGIPWMESLLEGSEAGRIGRRAGTKRSRDGRIKVEWEVVEWEDGDDNELGIPAGGTAKRKIGDVGADVEMRVG